MGSSNEEKDPKFQLPNLKGTCGGHEDAELSNFLCLSDDSSFLRKLCFWFFAGDFFGLLVFAQAEEGGLAQMIVARPFGEADFANELGIEPGAAFHFGGSQAAAEAAGFFREIHKRAIGPGEFLKFLVE
jgi:hypothetical protein